MTPGRGTRPVPHPLPWWEGVGEGEPRSQSLRYLVSGLCWAVGLLMLFWQPGRNLWIGVRLPWTLADAAIWKKSWRLASRLLMVMGVTVLISWRAFFISTAHLIGLTCLYTALRYRLKYGTWRYWKDLGWIDYHPVVRCAHCGHFQRLRHEGELPSASCEACGRLCRSRQREGLGGLRLRFSQLRRLLSTQGRKPPKGQPEPGGSDSGR